MVRLLFFFSVCLCFFNHCAVLAQDQKNILLLDHWHEDSLVTNSSKVRYNDCFGIIHEGKEYAVAGSTEGTHIFELTDENHFAFRAFVEGKYNSSMVIHRDYATYKNYLYAVCDEGNSSLQIIDYQYLPDSVSVVADLQNPFGRVHNVFIDTLNALLYACRINPIVSGTTTTLIPMRVFDISNPINPIQVWEGPNDLNEVHDIYVRDHRAILNCGPDGIRVYDFSNPSNPTWLSSLSIYNEQGYNHQGWLSPDGQTYVFADETLGLRLKKCRFDGTNLQIVQRFGTSNYNDYIPHNIMISDAFAYVAYYNEGLRIYDLRTNPPVEMASYDTFLESSIFKMNGAWGIFNQWPSGRILVSDRQNGLFLFDFDEERFQVPSKDEWQLFPNPVVSGEFVQLLSPNAQISEWSFELVDAFGKQVEFVQVTASSSAVLQLNMAKGWYTLRIQFENYLGEKESVIKSLVVY